MCRFSEAVKGKVVVSRDTSPLSVEQYRRLAATLHGLHVSAGLRTVMVSSALPRDGKTLTTTNLALTLSESYGMRVLLIDADLRRPSIHEVFGLDNRARAGGGSPQSVLPAAAGHGSVADADRAHGRHPRPASHGALTSERMAAILNEAATRFDWVLLDTPPIGLISDAQLLSALVDGVVLVVGAGSTDCAAVARTVADARTRADHRRGVEPGRRRARRREAVTTTTTTSAARHERQPVEDHEGALRSDLTRRSLALVAFETILIVLAVALGAFLRLGTEAWTLLFHERGLEKALLIAFVCQMCLYYADLYDLRVVERPARAVHPHRPGTRRRLVHPRRHLFLVPERWSSAAACSCVVACWS